jgi:hypothetical protein
VDLHSRLAHRTRHLGHVALMLAQQRFELGAQARVLGRGALGRIFRVG